MQEGEKRTARRIPLNARVRIRASGSAGPGIACRVRDSSAAGICLVPDGTIDSGWTRIEVLTSSGDPLDRPTVARIVRIDPEPGGGQEIGCSFE